MFSRASCCEEVVEVIVTKDGHLAYKSNENKKNGCTVILVRVSWSSLVKKYIGIILGIQLRTDYVFSC